MHLHVWFIWALSAEGQVVSEIEKNEFVAR